MNRPERRKVATDVHKALERRPHILILLPTEGESEEMDVARNVDAPTALQALAVAFEGVRAEVDAERQTKPSESPLLVPTPDQVREITQNGRTRR